MAMPFLPKNEMKDKTDAAKKKETNRKDPWEVVHPHAGGIDLASEIHYAAIGHADRDQDVRHFGTTTTQLRAMVEWFKEAGVTTVAMEATGVYWVPVAQVFEEEGLEVVLVHAAHVKGIPQKKTDVLDCMWLQKLHTFGFLKSCFRPKDEVNILRSYMRRRDILIKQATTHIHHMQKALDQMNVLVHRVLTDITGRTGMKIIRAIVSGKHDPNELMELRHRRCKAKPKEFVEALSGDFREEHLFSLKQALESYDFTQCQILACDQKMEKYLKRCIPENPAAKTKKIEPKRRVKNEVNFNVRRLVYELTGVDVMEIDGIGVNIAMTLISETGWTLDEFDSCEKFCSWLGLCSGNNRSGGKNKSGRTKKTNSRAGTSFRMAAQSVTHMKTPLGDYYRRMKARKGAPKAITATAHKLARIYYNMIKKKIPYDGELHRRDEAKERERYLRRLEKQAANLGFTLLNLQTGEITGEYAA